MVCTVAAIVALLGYMPPKGTVIIVPRSAIANVSYLKQRAAKACASRHGIQWRIDETR